MKKNLLYLSFLFLVAALNSCCKEEDELAVVVKKFYDKKGQQFFESAKVSSQDTTYSFYTSYTSSDKKRAKLVITAHGPDVMFLWNKYSSFTEEFVFEKRGHCDAWSLVSYSFEDKIDYDFKSYKADETKNLVEQKERIMRKLQQW